MECVSLKCREMANSEKFGLWRNLLHSEFSTMLSDTPTSNIESKAKIVSLIASGSYVQLCENQLEYFGLISTQITSEEHSAQVQLYLKRISVNMTKHWTKWEKCLAFLHTLASQSESPAIHRYYENTWRSISGF
eukprot:GHVP01014202.1.p1 GENE.GHVP01014202.1~~GHVP01014202.1.p1  ORF type:complete len:134 (-),score=13.84 GHVP01014202.1:306-707(-)